MHTLGNFELIRPLGRGGMAAVWEARHRHFELAAAVKVVVTGEAMERRYVEAFFAEARAHAGLMHPAIVRLYDYGHVGEGDTPPEAVSEGDPFLAMEPAAGTVRDLFPFASFEEIYSVLMAILDGLSFAHARGVVHRDLKPENVLRTGAGSAMRFMLSDFGIAQARGDVGKDVRTTLGASAGTPLYMAPEQLKGEWRDFGAPTDLYALGCMAWEMVTGRPPFHADNLVALANKHFSERPPPLESRFDVPEELESWLVRLLAKEPGDRYPSAADAAVALDHISRDFDAAVQLDVRKHGAVDAATLVLGETSGADDDGSVGGIGFAETVAPEADGTTTDGFDPSKAQDGGSVADPLPVRPFSLPSTWQTGDLETQNSFAGLGLFALRRPQIVAFEDERNDIWEHLRRVGRDGEQHTLVLQGGDRAPVAQLGEWFAARAREVGVLDVFRAFHTRAGGPREGLIGLVEDHFRVWGLDSEGVRERIGARLAHHAHEDLLEHHTGVLSSDVLAARAEEDFAATPRTRGDRYRSLETVVRVSAEQRPVVVWLENAQWGEDALSFADYLRESSPDLPILVLITLNTDALGKEAPAGKIYASLENDDHTSIINVRSYESEEHAGFIDTLIPLDERSRDAVIDLSAGDPVFAHTLLADLIARDALEPGREGFRFTVESLPGDHRALFGRRIEDFLRGFPEEQVDSVRSALEIAATLGTVPDPDEFAAVCAEAGIEVPSQFVGALEESGLARTVERRWHFVHEAVVHRIRMGARRAKRLQRWHRVCARVLEARAETDRSPTLLQRVARHYEAAGDLVDAVEPLGRAARRFHRSEVRSEVVDRRSDLLERLDVPEEDPRRVDQLNLESMTAFADGDAEASRSLAQRAARVAEEIGYDGGLADALRQEAKVLVDAGELGPGQTSLRRAGQLYSRLGRVDDEAAVRFGAGYIAYRLGDLGEAEELYTTAISTLQESGDGARQASVLSYLAALYIAQGRLDEAEESARRATIVAREVGSPSVLAEAASDLAEIARIRGDFGEARSRYEETRHFRELVGSRKVHVTRFNLALVEIGEGKFAEAEENLRKVEEHYKTTGMTGRIGLVAVALAACAMGRGNGEAFEAEMERADRYREDGVHLDVAWLLERAADFATRHDQPHYARRALRLAASEYEQLGNRPGHERTLSRLEALDLEEEK